MPTESFFISEDQSLRPVLAGALAALCYAVPYALSRPSSPTPDHPRALIWYKTLRKSPIQPPDLAIPLAWVAIESGLAAGAYRLMRKPASRSRNRALAWLGFNVAAIGSWSGLFFGGRSLPVSTAASAALLASSAAYTKSAREVDKVAASSGLALTAWVSFATLLTASLWYRNR